MAADTSPSGEIRSWKVSRGKNARVTVSINIDDKERASAEEEALKDLAKNVNVKGFRPGQAPREVVREQVTEDAIIDAMVRFLLRTKMSNIVTTENLRPIIPPQVNITSANPLSFDLVFIEEPEATVKSLDKKSFVKNANKVDDKDIERIIASLLKESASEKTVERPAKDGDVVVTDFVADDADGKEIPGTRADAYRVEIGSKTLIPGFEDGLIGVKAGDKKDLKLTFPEKYHAENLRGKPATFHFNVKEIREVTMPELTADLIAEKTGTREEPAAFRDSIRKRMVEQEENVERHRREEALFDAIEKATKVDLPDELVDTETNAMIEHTMQSLKNQQTDLKEWLEWRKQSVEDFMKEMKDRSKKRLTLRSGINALMKQHDIKATDNDPQRGWEEQLKQLLDKLLAD